MGVDPAAKFPIVEWWQLMIAAAAAVRHGPIAVTRSNAIGAKLLLDEADQLMCNGRTVKANRSRTGALRVEAQRVKNSRSSAQNNVPLDPSLMRSFQAKVKGMDVERTFSSVNTKLPENKIETTQS